MEIRTPWMITDSVGFWSHKLVESWQAASTTMAQNFMQRNQMIPSGGGTGAAFRFSLKRISL